MNEVDEFIAAFKKEEDIYSSWGELVRQYIKNTLAEKRMDSILKIEPSCRLKDISSLIEKAFYRSKITKTRTMILQIKLGYDLLFY
ncbi:hypothetical protein ACNNLV_RS20815 [Salmonella enterica subsp. enterica serovar Agona]